MSFPFESRNWRIFTVARHAKDKLGSYMAFGVGIHVAHTLEGVKFLDFGLLLGSVAVADGNIHAVLQCTAMYTTYGDTTCIRAVIE